MRYLKGNSAVIVIDIAFETQKVKKLLTNYALLERKHGRDITLAIKKRIDSFNAAVGYNDIIGLKIGNPHSLRGDLKGYSALNVTANVRLVYMVKGDTIYVKGVCDYHEGKINWIIV